MRAYVGLGLAVAVFSGSLFWAIQRLSVDDGILHAGQTSGSWLAVQAQTEYLRFADALDRYGLGDPAVSRETLVRRFEIFWSRLPLMMAGDESKLLRTLPGVPETVEGMIAALEAIEPAIMELRRGDAAALAEIRAQIAPFEGILYDLTQSVMLDLQVGILKKGVGQATDWVIASFAAVLLSVALMVFLLARQIGRSERLKISHETAKNEALGANKKLTAMAAELDDRVMARTGEVARTNIALTAEVRDRKKTEAALAESEQRFKTFAESSSDWMWEIDRDLRITFLSESFAESNTIPLSEVIGKTPAEARFEGDDLSLWRRLIAASQSREAIRNAEYRFVDREGRSRVLLLNGQPVFDEDGTFAGYRGCASDMSEQRRAERVARDHEAELAHMMRLSTMGEMASTLAHELNQPLAAIVNYVGGSMRRIESGAEENGTDLKGVLARIAVQAKRASKIIAHVSHFTRKTSPVASVADINDIIRAVSDLARAESGDREVAVRLELDEGLPKVRVNTIEIEQVILNLLRNGMEASKGTRKRTRAIVIESRANGPGTIEIAVTDRGRGLPEGSADRIFDPFFTTKRDGMGMGLSISRTIVESHGGQLWAEPGPTRGATFQFTLPCERGGTAHAG